MKYIIIILLFVIFSLELNAQVKIGSDGAMHPTGNYPVALQKELKAFALSYQTLAQRDAIPANFRDTGMLVTVRDSNAIYTLVGGITNSNWVQIGVNSSIGVIIVDTVYQDLNGLSSEITIPLTRAGTGFKNLEVESANTPGFKFHYDDTDVTIDYQVAYTTTAVYYIKYFY
jgi:hypothetical protein